MLHDKSVKASGTCSDSLISSVHTCLAYSGAHMLIKSKGERGPISAAPICTNSCHDIIADILSVYVIA